MSRIFSQHFKSIRKFRQSGKVKCKFVCMLFQLKTLFAFFFETLFVMWVDKIKKNYEPILFKVARGQFFSLDEQV